MDALNSYLTIIDPGVLTTWITALLTLMVYSYLIGDNPLFRLASHILVGSAVGYAAVIAYHSVLLPRLVLPLISDPYVNWTLFVPAILGVLLLTKAHVSTAWMGNTSMALLFGVGAALAIGGALSGTIVPQVGASLVSVAPADLGGGAIGLERAINNGILALGTVATLMYFYFGVSEGGFFSRSWTAIVGAWARAGRWIIMITFGAIFANTLVSRVTLLLNRVQFLLGDWLGLIP